jgi:hypothetical protein
MAIQSSGEFQVVLSVILMKVDQVLMDGGPPGLVAARRELGGLSTSMKKGEKPSERQVLAFSGASSAVRQAFKNDEATSDRLFDLSDYLDVNA